MKPLYNPPNPWVGQYHEWLEPPPAVRPAVYVERARSILSENDSPDLGFRWSVNPYRGCQHACAYCYARPTHEYFGWGAGTDFESMLVIKENAPALLRKALSSPRWRKELICFSGVTDCYQPLEAVWELTRRCLEVCLEFRNPACVVTKAYLIRRDADLLAELARVAGGGVCMSVAFADDGLCRAMEPQTPLPGRRFEAMRHLAEAGVPVGVLVAPVIPGLNDDQIATVLERAAENGASWASYVALRLPGSTEQVFLRRLHETLPLRARRVEARQREIHGGQLNECRFGERMRGRGPYWEAIEQLFEVTVRRLGLNRPPCRSPSCTAGPEPHAHGGTQLELPFMGEAPSPSRRQARDTSLPLFDSKHV